MVVEHGAATGRPKPVIVWKRRALEHKNSELNDGIFKEVIRNELWRSFLREKGKNEEKNPFYDISPLKNEENHNLNFDFFFVIWILSRYQI